MVLDLIESLPLPCTVIEIDETLEHSGRRSRFGCDRFTGYNAALQGAGIDGHRVPFSAHALGKGSRLGQSFLGESEFGLATEPFGRDALDMAMPGEQDLWHLALSYCAPNSYKSEATGVSGELIDSCG
jgi:hypothetical protein